jgi:phage gpG-like protein
MAGIGISFRVDRDDVSPQLSRMAMTAKNPLPVFRAMGTTFKAITEGNFNSVGAAFRPKPWVPKRDGSPSILQSRNPTLSKSFHLEVSNAHAKLSNPMKYAAIHQVGGVIRPKKGKVLRFQVNGKWFSVKQVVIPARPFFPVTPDGKLTPEAERLIGRAGERAIARQAGLK